MQTQCTQCGGAVALQEGHRFVVCPYCSSALYLDRSRVVFHFVVSATVSLEEAAGKLRRWMAGNETVKDLDVHANITQQELIYFPMWRLVAAEPDGEKEFSEPACSFAIAEIKSIPLSGGNLKFFSPQQFEGINLKEPDVLLESAICWLQDQQGVRREQIKEINLIHIPFYLSKYQYKGGSYQAIVDGISGRVIASVFPSKDEIPYIGVAVLATISFFVAGLIAPNLLIRLLLYLVVVIPFAIVSNGVVKKY